MKKKKKQSKGHHSPTNKAPNLKYVREINNIKLLENKIAAALSSPQVG
jgi:hypothetical protein